jgi:hypothetical protein
MPLLDAAGNPVGTATLPISNGVILEPIDQIPVIPDAELGAVIAQCNAAFQSGMQPNAPIGIDVGLLASLARTVRDQRKAIVKLRADAQNAGEEQNSTAIK